MMFVRKLWDIWASGNPERKAELLLVPLTIMPRKEKDRR